jgi:hypothetical protein
MEERAAPGHPRAQRYGENRKDGSLAWAASDTLARNSSL